MNTKSLVWSKVALWAIAAAALCALLCVAHPGQALAQSPDGGLAPAKQADQLATQNTYTRAYTFGTTASGRVECPDECVYTFTVGSTGADVNISITAKHVQGSIYYDKLYYDLVSTKGDNPWYGSVYTGNTDTDTMVYLPPGTYRLTVDAGAYATYYNNTIIDYSFKITKLKPSIKLGKKSGTLKPGGDPKEVSVIYNNCSYSYASKNLKIAKNTRPKVASASLDVSTSGVGTLKLTGKKMGVTKVKVKIKGGNAVTYTASAKSGFAVVAKGSKMALEKPIGVKGLKFVNKNAKSKKVAPVSKKGKVVAKKQGRAVVYAKKGKVKYTYTVVVTDFMKLARATYRQLEEWVPNPDKIKINYAYKGLSKQVYTGMKTPVVYIDFSYGNETGGWSRDKWVAWYDDALDPQWARLSTSNTIMKKKALSKAAIRK